MKAFWLTELSVHSTDPDARKLHLSAAVVRAGSLSDAKRALRAAGIGSSRFQKATRAQAAILPPGENELTAWKTADDDEWVIGCTVDEFLGFRRHI